MGATEFTTDSAHTQHKWESALAYEAVKRQYFLKYMGKGADFMIRMLTNLKKEAGDKITYGLRMKLSGDGVEGDRQIEGTSAEEALVFYSDNVYIDQRRKGTKSKGKMSEQRVAYNMRKEGLDALGAWVAEDNDECLMVYLAGVRGVDTTFHTSTDWTGRAGNSLTAPDSAHQVYGGDATSQAGLDSADTMSLEVVEKCISKAETTDPMIQSLKDNGEDRFILLMHTWDQHNLRTNSSEGDWQDLTKNARPRNNTNPIWLNALGSYAGVILHKNRNVIRPTATVTRSLFLGAQAGVIAKGGTGYNGKQEAMWNEETDDRGNQLAITVSSIVGTSETTFNSKRFGMIAVDCYTADPNA